MSLYITLHKATGTLLPYAKDHSALYWKNKIHRKFGLFAQLVVFPIFHFAILVS